MQPITGVPARSALAVLLAAGAVLPSCGSPTGPQPSPSPTASASAPPVAGGAVAGRYVLQINPSVACAAPRPSFTFNMDAVAGAVTPHRGTQVVLVGAPGRLEAEFIDENNSLRGGIGTTADGVEATEPFVLRIRVIASGGLLRGADGRGEVRSGTMMGTIGFSRPNEFENTLGTCVARDHTFTLSAR